MEPGSSWVPGSPPPESPASAEAPQRDWSPGENPPAPAKARKARRVSVVATSVAAIAGTILLWPRPSEPDEAPPAAVAELATSATATADVGQTERAPDRQPSGGVPRAESPAAIPPEPPAPAVPEPRDDEQHPVLQDLASLPVRSSADVPAYDRDFFGQTWADVDRNGCDTRNDILRRDLGSAQVKPGTFGCLVVSGAFTDPYSGSTSQFERGSATSGLVQIDHVVALADAWRSGAHAWDDERRLAFANDPLNLLAVDGDLNQEKGAMTAAEWLPPLEAARCGYAVQQVTVKKSYELSVTPMEKSTLETLLNGCAAVKLLAPGDEIPLGER